MNKKITISIFAIIPLLPLYSMDGGDPWGWETAIPFGGDQDSATDIPTDGGGSLTLKTDEQLSPESADNQPLTGQKRLQLEAPLAGQPPQQQHRPNDYNEMLARMAPKAPGAGLYYMGGKTTPRNPTWQDPNAGLDEEAALEAAIRLSLEKSDASNGASLDDTSEHRSLSIDNQRFANQDYPAVETKNEEEDPIKDQGVYWDHSAPRSDAKDTLSNIEGHVQSLQMNAEMKKEFEQAIQELRDQKFQAADTRLNLLAKNHTEIYNGQNPILNHIYDPLLRILDQNDPDTYIDSDSDEEGAPRASDPYHTAKDYDDQALALAIALSLQEQPTNPAPEAYTVEPDSSIPPLDAAPQGPQALDETAETQAIAATAAQKSHDEQQAQRLMDELPDID
jgi:hypothetical protein